MNNLFKSVAFLALAGAASAYGQQFNTLSSWDGSQLVSSFGYPNTATYGETFTAPGSALYDFTVEMKLPSTATFQGYLFAWDGTKATGSALYTSGVKSTTGSGSFEAVTFDVGGVPLTPGANYVFFASTAEDNGSGYGQWGLVNGDSNGGNFVYLNNGTAASQWTTTPWTSWSGQSSALTADFAPTPEPATLALAGLGGLALLLRKRK